MAKKKLTPEDFDELPEASRPMRFHDGRLQARRMLPDRLYDTVTTLTPAMPEALAWKLVAAIIAAIAADKGVDLS